MSSSAADYLGKYRLLRSIRAGSAAQVWEAVEEEGETRRRVALKVLLRKFRESKFEIDAMIHEANVGKSLDHENIIKIYEYQNIYNTPFIAMELFTARNLKIELRENTYDIAMRMKQIILDCAKSLAYLNKLGWVHCDVKPDNFLVDYKSGQVKLIDFSIAEKAKKGGLGALFARKPKAIRGTRSYMAPEQIRKQGVDHRTDIYGFGCVVFEMLAGRLPYSATNPDDLLRAHLTSTVPHLTSYGPATKEMSALVHRMMSKKPEERLQSVEEVTSEIKKISVYRAGHRPKKPVKQEPED